jgi:hypothetical protein
MPKVSAIVRAIVSTGVRGTPKSKREPDFAARR